MIAIDEKRQCYSCGRPLDYHQLYLTYHMQNLKKIFNDDMLYDIWTNPIFVIKCCICHRVDNRPYKCSKCGHGIEDLDLNGLCYLCFWDEKNADSLS